MVIVVEQIERARIRPDDRKNILRLGRIRNAIHEPSNFPQLRETALVCGVAIDHVLAQYARRPSAELDGALRFHAIGDRNDDVEAERLLFARDTRTTPGLNSRDFRARRLAVGFPFFIHVSNMSRDFCFVSSKKGGHLAFGEPNRILDEFDVELNFAIFRFKQHDFVSHIAPTRSSSTSIIFSQSSIRGKRRSAHCGIAASQRMAQKIATIAPSSREGL